MDFSQTKISELIAFAEEQAEKECKNRMADADPEHGTSWAATLEILKAMKERDVPELLAEES